MIQSMISTNSHNNYHPYTLHTYTYTLSQTLYNDMQLITITYTFASLNSIAKLPCRWKLRRAIITQVHHITAVMSRKLKCSLWYIGEM